MAQDLEFKITLVGDGKSLEGTLTASASQMRTLAAEAEKMSEKAGNGGAAAAKEIGALAGQIDETKKSAIELHEKLLGIGRGGVAVVGALAVGALGKTLLDAGLGAERLGNQLTFVTGSAVAAVQELSYLRATASRIGVDFTSAAEAYAKLGAAAKGTTLEGAQTRTIFESVSRASVVMGLSAQETSGALLAIGQMMSKGTVQAEELRGQLGERLPGAFQVAARAMGVTTAEMGKMLDNGEVMASSFLPRFAAELDKTLGDAPQSAAASAQAQLNRLNSSWDLFKQALASSGFLSAAANGLRILSAGIDSVNTSIGATIEREYKELERLQQLRAGEAAMGEDTTASDRMLVATRRRINALTEEARAEAEARAKRAADGDSDLARETARAAQALARTKVDTESINRYVENTARMSDAAKRRKAIDDEERAYKRLLAENRGADAGQKSRIEAAHQQRLASIDKEFEAAARRLKQKTDEERALDRMREVGAKNEMDLFLETGGEETIRIETQKRINKAIVDEYRASEKAADEHERKVAAILAQTESGKLELRRASMAEAAKLFAEGAITEQQWLEYAVAQNEKAAEKTADVWDNFAKHGAENIHDAFAKWLFNPFDSGLKGMLQSFGDMLRKMAAEAIAADLARKIFGSAAKGGEGDGLIGALISGVGALFGGGGAGSVTSGGSVQGNADYVFDLHSGGIAGQGGSALKLRDMSIFAEAPRYHRGGVAGLKPDEVPAVLRRGERVLTREQQDGMGQSINITVNVTGSTAPEVRRAAGQGAREALAAFRGAQRYG